MNKTHFFGLAGALVSGGLAVLILPADWLGYVAVVAVGMTLLLGVLNSVDAKDAKPLSPGFKVASYLLSGASRPNAIIKWSGGLYAFLLCATFVCGLGLTVLLLAWLT